MVIRIGQSLRQLSVVCQDQQSAGIQVQPPYRRDKLPGIAQQVVNGRATLRIVVSGQITLRLVQQQVGSLGGLKRFTVQRNLVPVEVHPMIGILDDHPIDGYSPGVNPASRFCSRTRPGLRQYTLQRLERSFLHYLTILATRGLAMVQG